MGSVDPGTVRFATVSDDEHGFTRSALLSLLPLLALDLDEARIWRGGYSIQGATSAGIVEGRNQVVEGFLRTAAEWLLWVDSDMGFEPDALERLMASADKTDRPIVGGLCFGFGPIGDRLGAGNATVKRPFPTIFDLAENDDDLLFNSRWWYLPNAVTRCAATGSAFVLIHRTVFEAMSAKWGHGCWYDRMKNPKGNKLWGEDTSFCMRANLLDIPVHVDTGVQTSHSKVIHVTQDVYLSQVIAPPATERVAVIVPVMQRPQNAEPFMTSLRASTGLATVYAICDAGDDDTIKAWDTAGATILLADGSSFPAKANTGYLSTDEPWLFLCGDDVVFRSGWLDHAQHTARVHGKDLVATNDLGNPRVVAGQHATHPLIRRTYIDELGASWDGPGVLVHEGYEHNFCDDEWTAVAKQRGAFAAALGSVVEHRHPLWDDTVEEDAVYRKGKAHAQKDSRLFKGRLKAYG